MGRMATIEERTGLDGAKSWRVKIRIKGLPPTTETFARKTDAKLWAQKTETAMREGKHFPERKRQAKTLAELIDRYIAEALPGKKSAESSEILLKWWRAEHGHRSIADLTPEALAEIRNTLSAKRNHASGRTGAISGSTVNRYMAVLSHAMSLATREWGWIADNPVKRVTKRKEPRGRVRMLSDDERERLLAACRASRAWALEPVVILALSTGMRRGEILGLRWADVDTKRKRLTLEETKNGERRGVPLSGPALDLLQKLAEAARPGPLVFPVRAISDAWRNAAKKAGLVDFRFHDLRHTAASYLAMRGSSPSEIAAVLGHKTLQMVKRYAHLSDAHVAGVMERMVEANLGGVTYSGGTKPS